MRHLHQVLCAKKVVSDSPGLADFVTRLVISIQLTCPMGKSGLGGGGGNSNCRRTVNNAHQNFFFGLVEMAFGLVRASYSLPELQTIELTLFAP